MWDDAWKLPTPYPEQARSMGDQRTAFAKRARRVIAAIGDDEEGDD
jgi:hypothetical protein